MSADARPPGPAPVRRFTLLDGMILVAAAAMAMGLLRGPLGTISVGDLIRTPWVSYPGWPHQFVLHLIAIATPLAASATLASLALRLAKPRPRWRRLARQPGLMACLAAGIAWAVGALYLVARALWFPDALASWNKIYLTCYVGSSFAGFAVMIAWSTLALARVGRPERSWIDRLGRLAGLAWVATFALAVYYALWLA